MSDRIKRLGEAIEAAHGCKAAHAASLPLIETFKGQAVWEGVVETFDLTGHPRPSRCYAWSYQLGAETHYTTVLEIPPVDSPETAVKVAVAAQARQ